MVAKVLAKSMPCSLALASSASSYATGEQFVIDGGYSIF